MGEKLATNVSHAGSLEENLAGITFDALDFSLNTPLGRLVTG